MDKQIPGDLITVAEAQKNLDVSAVKMAKLVTSLDSDVSPALDALVVSRELKLKEKLAPASNHYDFCVFDTPPALNLPTMNGLVVADHVS